MVRPLVMAEDGDHGASRLTPEGGKHMVLRKDKVEIENSGWDLFGQMRKGTSREIEQARFFDDSSLCGRGSGSR
jgi:hypothetical protein